MCISICDIWSSLPVANGPYRNLFCPLVRLGLVLQEQTRPSLKKGQKRFLCMISARFASKQSFMSIYWGGRFIRTHSHQRPDYTLYSFESTCTCINFTFMHPPFMPEMHLADCSVHANTSPAMLAALSSIINYMISDFKEMEFFKVGRSPSSYIFNNIVLEIFKPLHTFVHQIR